jgi:hypothetical protein
MSFIQREINKIRSELIESRGQHYNELYAAQQALEWALEPDGIRSPYAMILDILEETEDCSGLPHPGQS